MIETTLTGERCRTTTVLRSHRGLIKRSTEDPVKYDVDNLGRHLISVQWEIGGTDYVFPCEIEIIGEEELFVSA